MDPVTVCNMALNALGSNSITSIAEADINSAESQLCVTFYTPAVRACLEDASPPFATDLVNLGAKQASPYSVLGLTQGGLAGSASGSLFADQSLDAPRLLVAKFILPDTVLRPLACDDGSGTFTISWERAPGAIYCEDTVALYCLAVQYVDDPNAWN